MSNRAIKDAQLIAFYAKTSSTPDPKLSLYTESTPSRPRPPYLRWGLMLESSLHPTNPGYVPVLIRAITGTLPSQ
eukprot:1175701-Prorocentrum_minimum.AAC.5